MKFSIYSGDFSRPSAETKIRRKFYKIRKKGYKIIGVSFDSNKYIKER